MSLTSTAALAQERAFEFVKKQYSEGHFWLTSYQFDQWVEDNMKVIKM